MTSTSTTLHSKNNTRSNNNNNKSVFVTLQSFYYRVVGPTDAHLVHECFLLCCLMLLTIASMLSMYRYSFGGENGDWSIVVVTSLWLSRHVVVRIVCTSDGTSRKPWLRRLCGTNFTAGQYFDPPTRLHITEAATFFAHVLTVLQHLSFYIRFFLSAIPRAFVYIRNYYYYLRSTTTTKLTPTTSSNNNVMMPTTYPSSSSLAATTATTPVTTATAATAHQILNKYWNSIPPFQLVMAASVFFLCVTTIFNLHANSSSLTGNPNTHSHSYYSHYMNSNSYGAARVRSMRAADHHPPNNNNNIHHPATTTITAQLASSSTTLNHFVGGVVGKRAWQNKPYTIAVGPFGFDSPTITQYLLCIVLWGTMASILVYGRLLLPIPDLASNIKHHHRNSSSSNTHNNKSSDILSRQIIKNSGGGTKSNSNKGSNTTNTNYSTHNNNNNTNDIPWAERDYKSINNENRFRLHCTVILLRMIENVFVCLILPQTPFACRVTAHCEPSSVIWGNDAAFLLSTSKETASSSMYDALPPDMLSNLAIAISISTVTAVLLLAQALALDKSNLSLIVSTSQQRSYYDGQMMNTTTNTNNNSNNTMVLSSSEGATFDGSNNNSKTNNTNYFSSSGIGGGTSSQKRRNKGKGGVGSDAFSTWNMSLGGSSSDNLHSGNTVRSGGGIHSSDTTTTTTTTRYYDVFQYELGHFSQSTVLRNLSTIQMICITLVSLCCVYRFLTNLNFLALSVALFANVLAAFAISGPSDTTELEQISEDIRNGLMMIMLEDTTTKSGSSTRAKKK